MTDQRHSPDSIVLTELDDDGVLTVVLNRPERRNSWSPDLESEFFETLDSAQDDAAVKAIVVTGAGRHFCPGVDMQRLDALAGKPVDLGDRRPFHRPYDMSKPLVAAINGACAGVGLILALMCDVRFAAREARFATSFARRGLPAERGASWLLTRLVGPGRAADLLLSGRSFDAEEALSLGVLNWLSDSGDVVADAQRYAGVLARDCSPKAMAVIKRQLRDDLDHDFIRSYATSMSAMMTMAESDDFREGVDSFVQKRPPRFAGITTEFDAEEMLRS